MKKIFAVILMLALLLSGCRVVAPDELISDNPAELLEFPGLQWNMSPEAIIEALNLQDEDLMEVPADEVRENCYEIRVKGEALGELFGEDVALAAFSCYDFYEGENQGRYGLGSVDVIYEQDADMEAVREKLTERYGAESPYKYLFIEPSSGWQTSREFDAADPPEETRIAVIHELVSSEVNFYWGSERKEGDYITGDIKAAYSNLLKNVNPPDENFDESLDAALQECNAAFIHMRNGVISKKSRMRTEIPEFLRKLFLTQQCLCRLCKEQATGWNPLHKFTLLTPPFSAGLTIIELPRRERSFP